MDFRSLSKSPRAAGIIFLAIGFVFAVGGLIMKRQGQKVELSGVTNSGTILRGWVKHRSKRRDAYHLEVAYRAEGSVWQRSFSIHRAYYFEHMNEAEKVTQAEVLVRYQRSDPANAILVGAANDGDATLWAGLVALGMGAAFLAFAVVRKRANP